MIRREAKEKTIELYRKLLSKIKSDDAKLGSYGSFHHLKTKFVPEFGDYMSYCPLCDFYLRERSLRCIGCPLVTCTSPNSYWARITTAFSKEDREELCLVIDRLIKEVEKSL